MLILRFTAILYLLLLTAPLRGQTDWASTTKVTADNAYLSTGRITVEGEMEDIWKIFTDYEGISSWLPKGLDSPQGGKQPVFIQNILFHPEWPALELLYGIRLLGLLKQDNLSAVFAIEEEKTPRARRLTLTLTRKLAFLTEASYGITLFASKTPGITEALFSVRTKLPPLLHFLFPRNLYVETARHILEQVIKNLVEENNR